MDQGYRSGKGCPGKRGNLKTRREFLSEVGKCSKAAAGVALFGSTALPDRGAQARTVTNSGHPGQDTTLDLPAWTSPSANSNVFAVTNVPRPRCSLANGSLPSSGPCAKPSYVFPDGGIDALLDLMESHGTYFYQTASRPQGIIGANDFVIIKINNQWGGLGDDNGLGRLCTNTDALKGLIWRILRHPSGFTGAIIVAENVQEIDVGFDVTPANAQDQNQTYRAVVDTFSALNYPVSIQDWNLLNYQLIPGSGINDPGYPVGEFAQGNHENGYILLNDPGGAGTNEFSYPKFYTASGAPVSMRYGPWEDEAYHPSRLKLINFPVLKRHGMAGATIAWKNLIGFVTVSDNETRYTGWDNMHDFFWGYTNLIAPTYGLIGRQMALVRAPNLNIVDAIWVAYEGNTGGNAVRQDVLLASTDPFAVDWYASEYILLPLAGDQMVTAARGGTFRSATRVNQKSSQLVWTGTYPFMEFLDGYDGDTPSDEERNQMNVYVADASHAGPTVCPPPYNLLLE